jgi:hypothetical protein
MFFGMVVVPVRRLRRSIDQVGQQDAQLCPRLEQL